METEQEVKQLEENLKQIEYKPIHSPLKGWKTKSGEVISYKEAIKRWKEGMQNLRPVQRTFNDLVACIVVLIGFIVSVGALIFFNKTFGAVTYGLIIIFLGNIYSNTIKLFSLFGQYKLHKGIENQFKVKEEINEKEVNNGY